MSDRGLDLIRYAVDDSLGRLGRTFATAAGRPLPCSAVDRETWQRHGLRVVAVPVSELEGLLFQLKIAGPVEHESFTTVPRWTAVALGGLWREDRAVAWVQQEGERTRLALRAGRLRLLMREWEEPVLVGGATQARVHIELVPQHEESGGNLAAMIESPPRAIDRFGRVFDELTMRFIAVPGEAYVIVSEAPGVTWSTGDEASNDQPGGAFAQAGNGEHASAASLGEALLSDAVASGSARTKLLVVLLPHSGGSFELTPAAR